MYLGHATVTICLQRGIKNLGVDVPLFPFFLGALFPDLIDKPLAFISHSPGRYICHSAVLLTALFLVLQLALPRVRKFVCVFFAGALLHLVQDIPIDARNVFWPLLGSLYYVEVPSLFVNLWHYYVEIAKPIHWAVEMISLPWALAILLGYNRRARAQAVPVQAPVDIL